MFLALKYPVNTMFPNYFKLIFGCVVWTSEPVVGTRMCILFLDFDYDVQNAGSLKIGAGINILKCIFLKRT